MSEGSIVSIVVAFLAFVGVGLAALRKSKSESDKATGEAAAAIAGASGDVVKMLHDEMRDLRQRENRTEDRITALENAVVSWEGWAERVLNLLDKAMEMLAEEQRRHIAADVERVKATKPMRIMPPD